MFQKSKHTFHIPVMGTGFTIDSPFKVAKFGIDSVVSLVDDVLIEKIRKLYSEKYHEPFKAITSAHPDSRAARITAYLNLINKVVKQQIVEMKTQDFKGGSDLSKYFQMLPDHVPAKIEFAQMIGLEAGPEKEQLQKTLRGKVVPGSIDANIMTKLDRDNYKGAELRPKEFSDALSAFRGFAQSDVKSAMVFSAGFNRRLFNYLEGFEQFFPDADGHFDKKFIIKVSDYRSASTQGRFLAKKGIWVYEYRIESGLNCGGHVFPTEGVLLGPVLEEFRKKRGELSNTLFKLINCSREKKGRPPVKSPPPFRITVQGGVGTAKEHTFLLDHYGLDSVGWATPFLLVPEATTVDKTTRDLLCVAEEKDLYTSRVSPLGVPFNNLRPSLSDAKKKRRAWEGMPGSPCPKGFVVSNTEFSKKPLCLASRTYQKKKIKQIQNNKSGDGKQLTYKEITIKACICHDLGTGALVAHGIKEKNPSPAVCPGPNMAFFNKIVPLSDMISHIYGKLNLISRTDRPDLFSKEISIYLDYLKEEINAALPSISEININYFSRFKDNLLEGIKYYQELASEFFLETRQYKEKMLAELEMLKEDLETFITAQSFFIPATEG